MEKAVEVFYNVFLFYSLSYYWLDVEEKIMFNMNEGVEVFWVKLELLGVKNIGIYVGVYFMEEYSIDIDKFMFVWIFFYGFDLGFYEIILKIDLDYDIY